MKPAVPDFSLVLACYNEESIFEKSVEEIITTLCNCTHSFEIIFVDDKSCDTTPHLIDNVCKKYQFCRALYNTKNYGRGRTIVEGIRASHGGVVGFIDIDIEISPMYIPSMVSLIYEGYADVVIGRRIYQTTIGSLTRELFSIGYQRITNIALSTGGLDTETGYKIFNRAKILPLLKKTMHPHWFWDTEIMVFAKRSGLSIAEIPVLFLRRSDKKSSVRLVRDITDYLFNLFKLFTRLKREELGL